MIHTELVAQFENHIVAYIENETNLNFSDEKIISPDEFKMLLSFLIDKITTDFDNIENFSFLNDFLSLQFNEYLKALKLFDVSHEKDLFTIFKISIFLLCISKVFKEEEVKKYFTFSQEIAFFKSESVPRIKLLQSQLCKKHELLAKKIDDKFNNLISEIEQELNQADSYFKYFNTIEIGNKNACNLIVPVKKQGRPNDQIIDIILVCLDEIAEKIAPKTKYSSIIIPSLVFFSNLYPEQIDKNEFLEYEKLRTRVRFLKAKLAPPENNNSLH